MEQEFSELDQLRRQLSGFESHYGSNMLQLLQALTQVNSNIDKLRVQIYEMSEENRFARRALNSLRRTLIPTKRRESRKKVRK